MRKELTCSRARIVDRAQIAFEKYAAVLVALQDAAFFCGFDRVVAQEIGKLQTQIPSQMLRIAVIDLRRGDSAAVRAARAIHLILNILRNRLEPALDKVMALQPGAKSMIFLALLLAEALNLHEIRHHPFSISVTAIMEA